MTCSQEEHLGTSMVAQGLRLHLSMQGAQVQSLLRELRFPHAWGPKPKTKNRNNIVTNSMKTFKMVYIKKKKKRAFLLGAPDPNSAVCLLLSDGPSGHPRGGMSQQIYLLLLARGRETLGLGHLPLLVGGLETPHPYVVPLVLGLQTRWLLYDSPFRVLFCLFFVLFMDLQLYFLGMSR